MSSTSQERLGRYTLGTLLGSSSLGAVYRASDVQPGLVAIKVLRRYLAQEPDIVAAYQGENERLRALGHPNILAVDDTGSDESPWAAMEFMPRGSLKDLADGTMAVGEISRVLERVADALDAAHGLGVLHGDLKPSNVFLTESGDYKLADFGMATLAGAAHPLVRASGSTPMPSYMSPEQALDMTLTQRSDVFSLAVLAYQLLTGRVPHQGTDPTTIWAKQLKAPPERPDRLNPQVPPAVGTVVLRALSTNPDRRPASAGEFARAFRDALTRAPSDPAQPSTEDEFEPSAGPFDVSFRQAALGTAATAGAGAGEKVSSPSTGSGSWSGASVFMAGAEVDRGSPRARAIVVFLVAAIVAVVSSALLASGRGENVLPVSAVSSISGPGEWAMHQGGPKHLGTASVSAPTLTGDVKWSLLTGDPLTAQPVIADGILYVATGDRRLLAIEADSGDVLWERPVPAPVDATPAVAGDLVYTTPRGGGVLAFDRVTGEPRWVVDLEGPVFSSPVVKNGRLFIGDGAGAFHALDAVTGEPLWRFWAEEWIGSSAAVSDDGVVVVGSRDGNIYLLDEVSGTVQLDYRAIRSVESGPAIVGDRAYVGIDGGIMLALDLNERRRPFDKQFLRTRSQLYVWNMLNTAPVQRGNVWSVRPGSRDAFISTPAVAHDTIVVVNRDGAIHAVDRISAERRWSFDTDRGPNSTSPLIAGETVFFSGADGSVYGLSKASGEVVWEWRALDGLVPSASPVLGENALYVAASHLQPPTTYSRLDAQGNEMRDQSIATRGDWRYQFAASPCVPEPGPPVGPFETRAAALLAAGRNATACGVLYAIE